MQHERDTSEVRIKYWSDNLDETVLLTVKGEIIRQCCLNSVRDCEWIKLALGRVKW